MRLAFRERLAGWLRAAAAFMRTPTLARQLAGLLALGIALLLVVNLATVVLIARANDFNETVEQSHRVRTASKDVLTRLIDAETGQRGYILTEREEYLGIHDEALRALPELFSELERLTADDPQVSAHVRRVRALSIRRLDLMERTILLARVGRYTESVALIRGGQGKVYMDQLRREIAAIDALEYQRLEARRTRSEWAARATLGVNLLAAVLVVGVAALSLWLIRRYVADLTGARDALDRLNAGLEEQVRARTGALTRANEEIQRFAYIVSHDLRAPLVNIMGYTSELETANRALDEQVDVLEARAPKSLKPETAQAVREDIPEAIGFIRASTEKMDRLINAILKLSREGRRTLTPEPLDVSAMVRKIADSVRHQTESAGAEIVIDALPTLTSDRLSLEQIFGNLIDNAVKYLDPSRPGRIQISGEDDARGTVTYRVADNGRGVSPKDHERIFELFRRSGRQDRPGEGLGLAFVRNSVRRLGGVIDVESELGQGSTFILKFPKRLSLDPAGDAA